MFERYIFACILFILLDAGFLWLNKVIFQNQVINVQRVIIQRDYFGMFMAYISLCTLLCYFIIRPHRPVGEAFLLGALVYGVFEFTNKAIFKKWEYMTVALDTLWGGILFGLVTHATYWYHSR